MGCIKCGKDTAPGAEFCEECLAEMEYYPVKPGTPVILPKREEPVTKHTRKKTLKPEAQVASLKRTVRGLWGLIVLLLLIIAAAAFFIFWLMNGETTSLLP